MNPGGPNSLARHDSSKPKKPPSSSGTAMPPRTPKRSAASATAKIVAHRVWFPYSNEKIVA